MVKLPISGSLKLLVGPLDCIAFAIFAALYFIDLSERTTAQVSLDYEALLEVQIHFIAIIMLAHNIF